MTDSAVVVGTFSDALAAHLARSRLEAAGIEAHVYDEHTVMNDPLLSGALGGVKVVVAEGDAEAARAVLEQERGSEETITCPSCDSSKVEKLQFGRRAAFLTLLFLGLPIGRARNKLRCEDCQQEWRE